MDGGATDCARVILTVMKALIMGGLFWAVAAQAAPHKTSQNMMQNGPLAWSHNLQHPAQLTSQRFSQPPSQPPSQRLAQPPSQHLPQQYGLEETAPVTKELASGEGAFLRDFSILREQNQHIQNIGWKLIRGNAQFCDTIGIATYSVGLELQDVRNFAEPEKIRALYGIAGDIFVHSLAENGRAQLAGVTQGAEMRRIGTQELAQFSPSGRGKTWRRAAEISALMRAQMSGGAPLEFQLAGSEQRVKIAPQLICASWFELHSDQDGASANGRRVAIGQDFVGLTYPEEELAAAIAHELAHNVMRHPEWLDDNGRSRSNVRKTEQEADRLMPWLLANAGYDPAAALRFMRRWGPRHGGGLLRRRTHDGWDERADKIALELPLIATSESLHNGGADWALDFRREYTR